MNNEMNNENTSGINTVLIVTIIIVIVGFGVWWATSMNVPKEKDTSNDTPASMDIEVSLPDSDEPATTN